ncbi:hypothetical protein JL720_14248 [Aureococcus anophagefferens]|nr:hypothetical protein JL720_14248 [Aureococcus anophagefferens]
MKRERRDFHRDLSRTPTGDASIPASHPLRARHKHHRHDRSAKLQRDFREKLRTMLLAHIGAMREEGLVFEHVFEERRLGIHIALARYGDEGREFIQIDGTEPFCDLYPGPLKPTDELIAYDDTIIVEPRTTSFDKLRDAIAHSPRPLKLTFIEGERRDEAFREQEERRSMARNDVRIRCNREALAAAHAAQVVAHADAHGRVNASCDAALHSIVEPAAVHADEATDHWLASRLVLSLDDDDDDDALAGAEPPDDDDDVDAEYAGALLPAVGAADDLGLAAAAAPFFGPPPPPPRPAPPPTPPRDDARTWQATLEGADPALAPPQSPWFAAQAGPDVPPSPEPWSKALGLATPDAARPRAALHERSQLFPPSPFASQRGVTLTALSPVEDLDDVRARARRATATTRRRRRCPVRPPPPPPPVAASAPASAAASAAPAKPARQTCACDDCAQLRLKIERVAADARAAAAKVLAYFHATGAGCQPDMRASFSWCERSAERSVEADVAAVEMHFAQPFFPPQDRASRLKRMSAQFAHLRAAKRRAGAFDAVAAIGVEEDDDDAPTCGDGFRAAAPSTPTKIRYDDRDDWATTAGARRPPGARARPPPRPVTYEEATAFARIRVEEDGRSPRAAAEEEDGLPGQCLLPWSSP